MKTFDEGAGALTPEESWQAIRSTVDDARSSMYLAGSATILLLWGVIAPLGFLSQHAIETLAGSFAENRPWYPGPLWGGLAVIGMAGSAIIGHRAGRNLVAGDGARSAGLRVFFFWLAVMAAVFLLPMAAGLWNADGAESIPRVAIGVVALAYILFGLMTRPLIAVVGMGIAVAFYVPSYLAGDAALVISAVAMLAVTALAFVWIRQTGEW